MWLALGKTGEKHTKKIHVHAQINVILTVEAKIFHPDTLIY